MPLGLASASFRRIFFSGTVQRQMFLNRPGASSVAQTAVWIVRAVTAAFDKLLAFSQARLIFVRYACRQPVMLSVSSRFLCNSAWRNLLTS